MLDIDALPLRKVRVAAHCWPVQAANAWHLPSAPVIPFIILKAICSRLCWQTTSLEFPFVALLVSGGRYALMAVHGIGDDTLLGESVDEAGEAFDKTAKLFRFALYPGGANCPSWPN